MVTLEEIAEYAFMSFVVIAVIAGLAIGSSVYLASEDADVQRLADLEDINGYVTLAMLVLGIVVGLISITAKEVGPFLVAAIALMVTRVGLDVWEPLSKVHDVLYYWAVYILNYIVAFVAPAAVIIAVRSVWVLARKK